MTTGPQVQRLAKMATDSQELMVLSDLATKGHARIRNGALMRLHAEYGLDSLTISHLTGIKDRTIRNALFRQNAKDNA